MIPIILTGHIPNRDEFSEWTKILFPGNSREHNMKNVYIRMTYMAGRVKTLYKRKVFREKWWSGRVIYWLVYSSCLSLYAPCGMLIEKWLVFGAWGTWAFFGLALASLLMIAIHAISCHQWFSSKQGKKEPKGSTTVKKKTIYTRAITEKKKLLKRNT